MVKYTAMLRTRNMTTDELFELISALPEFKDYPFSNSRTLKTRHKNGTLSTDNYAKIFDYFGYYKPDDWQKKKEKK